MADEPDRKSLILRFVAQETHKFHEYIDAAIDLCSNNGAPIPKTRFPRKLFNDLFKSAGPEAAANSQHAAVKRPLSTFNLFMKEKMEASAANEADEGMPHKERFSRCVAEWKALTDEAKQAFREKYEAEGLLADKDHPEASPSKKREEAAPSAAAKKEEETPSKKKRKKKE